MPYAGRTGPKPGRLGIQSTYYVTIEAKERLTQLAKQHQTSVSGLIDRLTWDKSQYPKKARKKVICRSPVDGKLGSYRQIGMSLRPDTKARLKKTAEAKNLTVSSLIEYWAWHADLPGQAGTATM